MKNKPIIGIVSKHYAKYKDSRTDTFVGDELKQAIFDNGGVAIGILPTEDKIKYSGDNWRDDLSKVEKENLISQIKLCDGIILQGGIETDNYESIVSKYCYDNDIPILGICAGQNNIVRALGGTTCKIPNPEKHNKSFYDYAHNVTINECPLLEKVGFCEDGYPDIVESKDKKFYIGVRFHPESLYKKNEYHNRIFEYFINCCKK